MITRVNTPSIALPEADPKLDVRVLNAIVVLHAVDGEGSTVPEILSFIGDGVPLMDLCVSIEHLLGRCAIETLMVPNRGGWPVWQPKKELS